MIYQDLFDFFSVYCSFLDEYWGGITNDGIKPGKSIANDGCQATTQIYLDGQEISQPIEGLTFQCDDSDGPNPFRFTEANGNLILNDRGASYKHYALCQMTI